MNKDIKTNQAKEALKNHLTLKAKYIDEKTALNFGAITNQLAFDLIEALEREVVAQEWQSIEIKPKHDNDVLVYFEKGFIGVAKWDKKEKEWQQDGYNILGSRTGNSDITHWKELPPAP